MNKEKKELQTRREFFKNVAQKALPMLGAIVLAGSPSIAKAIEEKPMGCGYTCKGECSGGCDGSCQWGCSGTCKGGCEGCRNSCSGSCQGFCRNGCYGSSK